VNAVLASGAVIGGPRIILRLEGAALAIGAAFFFWRLDGSWALFAILFFAPDLSFLGYLASPRTGAIAYNGLHSTIGPFALFAIGAWMDWGLTEKVGLIWLAHVGFDRALGYGLKYGTAFGDTHLGRLGASAAR
jgi:hypothetical protein